MLMGGRTENPGQAIPLPPSPKNSLPRWLKKMGYF